MRRGDRLFEIIQLLRRARGPVTAEAIAAELETSRRTVYRDIAALLAQRVPIRGEAGIGYVLDAGFDLPPLMFDTAELEAVVLGAQWVAAHADPSLARAAGDVLAKVAAVVPERLRHIINEPAVIVAPPQDDPGDAMVDIARLRAWCMAERKITIHYVDEGGTETHRTVWPFLIGYRDHVRIVAAWCELRDSFRMFRTDRLRAAEFLETRYPARRRDLSRRWLALIGAAPA